MFRPSMTVTSFFFLSFCFSLGLGRDFLYGYRKEPPKGHVRDNRVELGGLTIMADHWSVAPSISFSHQQVPTDAVSNLHFLINTNKHSHHSPFASRSSHICFFSIMPTLSNSSRPHGTLLGQKPRQPGVFFTSPRHTRRVQFRRVANATSD